MEAKTYLVAGYKPWNRRIFDGVISKYSGRWHLIEDHKQLNLGEVRTLNPHHIFFLRWSWKVPDEIAKKYECVCFHMTGVTYGRGGSPLQNFILRRHKQTKLTALRMLVIDDMAHLQHYYIVVDEQGIPNGQVRFDICSEGSAAVDVSIDVKKIKDMEVLH